MGNKATKETIKTVPASLARPMSLMNANKEQRLDIIKRRMSSDASHRKPRTFIKPPK